MIQPGAPRLLSRPLRYRARGALRVMVLWLASLGPAAACDAPAVDAVPGSVDRSAGFTAWYADLTDRYAHSVLGDAYEPQTLRIAGPRLPCGLRLTLKAPHVFEDLAPRLADLNGDDVPELVTVRSHAQKGAQVAVYMVEARQRLILFAQTPYIGTRNRWLAPTAVADLDGDGAVEIAYIDRPHLAKRLRIWRFIDGQLHPVAALDGLTNHRIGEDYISGGLRDCGNGPEMILADAGWNWVMAAQLAADQITSRRLGPFTGRSSMDAALACKF